MAACSGVGVVAFLVREAVCWSVLRVCWSVGCALLMFRVGERVARLVLMGRRLVVDAVARRK